MAEAYRVFARSHDGRDSLSVLQVLADSPAEAACAVREKVGDGATVEVDERPLTYAQAVATGVISGKVLLG